MKRTASAAKKYNYDYIREAYRSFKKGNYSNSVIILEKASGAGLDEPYPVFLLALSYLYSGDYTKAENALLKIERTDPRYAPYIQLKSFLAMKGALTPVEALSAYISALEKLPADRMLKKGLLKIEKSADFYKLQKSARISSFVKIPSPGGKGFSFFKSSKGEFSSKKERGVSVKTGVKLSILMVTAIIISTAVFLYFYYDEIERMVFREQNGSRVIAGADKIDMINLSGSGYGLINKVNRDVTPEFYVSGDQLHKDFEVKNFFKEKPEVYTYTKYETKVDFKELRVDNFNYDVIF
ncbi:MAG: hypothetical protein EOM23_10760, partial [Candidatus Moranbacteria bacterium]|nr:hypothetical protein [Candidatus Moranbacteria bacterium]